MKHQLNEAKHGEEALQILRDKSKLPDIILLGLNMLNINGIEFLKILENDSVLKYIPTYGNSNDF
ncbi:response regulator [Leeuwenhoekiella marinoflava]|uniref:Response regulator receiver domain-containing protein n=2 Tax=Leeuwenhoekiella marinoflava TaxID=988 RepID=A0A4Q0PRL4_9FLAO|nr:response regulator [Leeuwenhoekiella marinoflava]RXG32892.1 response regulator receiver domain-containing protein [Leeuwenhoekiella marinoflava]SHE60587.1 Response regulator receiver domain-containing protein [Leeuwenhoekiella marinoflava DSM 3653]